MDNHELYNFARWVAASNPRLNNETVGAVEKFLRMYLVELWDKSAALVVFRNLLFVQKEV